jgi:Tfp pilus assembly protein PilO
MALNLDLSNINWRDPRILMRAVLFTLVLANLTAFYFVLWPLGGSPEELDVRVSALQQQVILGRRNLERLRGVSAKMTEARREAEQFESCQFTDRRVAYSTLVGEISRSAQEAGLKVKEHALANEEVEGSDTLGMITVNGNYEGTYGDLIQFISKLDRSPRFILMDSLAAQPQQGTNVLNIAMKMNLFVRQLPVSDPGAPPAAKSKELAQGGPAL